jgi:hypothetical protein
MYTRDNPPDQAAIWEIRRKRHGPKGHTGKGYAAALKGIRKNSVRIGKAAAPRANEAIRLKKVPITLPTVNLPDEPDWE